MRSEAVSGRAHSARAGIGHLPDIFHPVHPCPRTDAVPDPSTSPSPNHAARRYCGTLRQDPHQGQDSHQGCAQVPRQVSRQEDPGQEDSGQEDPGQEDSGQEDSGQEVPGQARHPDQAPLGEAGREGCDPQGEGCRSQGWRDEEDPVEDRRQVPGQVPGQARQEEGGWRLLRDHVNIAQLISQQGVREERRGPTAVSREWIIETRTV